MAGHSKWKNIQHRKGAQDAKRAKVFTKIIRELTVAAKSGLPDPEANPRLRTALIAARAANMSRDTIERAIKRGSSGEDTANYEEVRYEGYGAGGVAVIVEVLTDNRNRTAGEIRSAFSKNGGTFAETGAVSYLFDRLGVIRYPAAAAGAEAMFEAAVEAGADDCQSSEDGHEIVCAPADLAAVRDALVARFGEPEVAKLHWRPQTSIALDEANATVLFKMINAIDDNDDVQEISANYEVSDEIMEKLSI